MIKFKKYKNVLLLEYSPEQNPEWVKFSFEKNKSIQLRRTFSLSKDDLFIDESIYTVENYIEDSSWFFMFGVLVDDYFKINSNILSIKLNLYIHKRINVTDKFFTAYRNISIFSKIEIFVNEDIYIGYDENSLPLDTFLKLLKIFPGSTELTRYSNARISGILREFYNVPTDDEKEYDDYIKKKEKMIISPLQGRTFANQEYEKYKLLLNELTNMLNSQESVFEKTWQHKILNILLLLYPKYIGVFEEVDVKDVYQNKIRRLDFLLVDFNGNVDIVEIKKPSTKSVVSDSTYRDNYIPLRELSATVMQIEKYIFYLDKWGKEGETQLAARYNSELPDNMPIKVINPKAIIIMGRDCMLSKDQLMDFELIKRKYNNVIDIITYDDIIRRLNHIIFMFSKELGK